MFFRRIKTSEARYVLKCLPQCEITHLTNDWDASRLYFNWDAFHITMPNGLTLSAYIDHKDEYVVQYSDDQPSGLPQSDCRLVYLTASKLLRRKKREKKKDPDLEEFSKHLKAEVILEHPAPSRE